jgi:hypothetical protein
MNCDEERRCMVEGITEPHEVMELFRKTYASSETKNLGRVQRELYHFRYEETKSAVENINALKERRRALEGMTGEAVSDHTMWFCLLFGLPDSVKWSTLKQIWENESGLTFESLCIKVMNADLATQDSFVAKKQDATALVTRDVLSPKNKKHFKKTKCVHCSKTNHKSADCYFKDRAKRGKFCNFCRKPGHTETECRKKKADQDGDQAMIGVALMADGEAAGGSGDIRLGHDKEVLSGNTVSDTGTFDMTILTNGVQNLVVNPDAMALMASGQAKSKETWILDSGCTSHMTGNQALFKLLESRKDISPIVIANKQQMHVKGLGTVALSNGVTLTDVLSVPELKHNLLSVSKMATKGYKVVFDEHSAFIKKNDQVIVTLPLDGALYTHKALFNFETTETGNKQESKYDDYELVHKRLGHIGHNRLKKLMNLDSVKLKCLKTSDLKHHLCESCIFGKMHRSPFPKKSYTDYEPGEVLHSDLVGPLPTSVGGSKYICTFIDGKTNYCSMTILKNKSEVRKHFIYVHQRALKLGHQIKCLRSDNGGEYINNEIDDYLLENGIQHDMTAPYTPQQNGKAERYNRTLIEMVRCLLHQSQLEVKWWAEAANTAAYILNCSSIYSEKNITAYEYWTGHKPDFQRFKVFGCVAYAHINKEKRTKLDYKATKGVFMGYDKSRKAYRIYDPDTKDMIISRDVVFDEKTPGGTLLNNQSNIFESLKSLDEFFNPYEAVIPTLSQSLTNAANTVKTSMRNVMIPKTMSTQTTHLKPMVIVPPPSNTRQIVEIPFENELAMLAGEFTSLTSDASFMHHFAHIASENEPCSYQEALQSDEWERWQEAILSEYNSLLENETWELVELPKGRKTIQCRWIFKRKYDESGNLIKYKARLVAKGYSQQHGIDYNETFAPVVKFSSLRTLLALAAKHNLEIEQMDFVTAFLNGDLKEDIYMKQPEGFIEPGKENLVLKLKKSLYGLKQAPREWNNKLHECLHQKGFKRVEADHGVYVMRTQKTLIMLALWVDDLVIIGNNMNSINNLKQDFTKRFKVKDLGPIHFIVGIEVIRNRQKREIFLTQRQYVTNILKKFNMSQAKPLGVPVDKNIKLCKNGSNTSASAEPATKAPYREAVGSLIYAMVATRPDLAFAVGLVSRYMHEPKQSHWEAVKRILRYLQSTADYGILYGTSKREYDIMGYSDSDWGNDLDDAKSTSGYCFKIYNGAISWYSRKQQSVAKSSVEAEYVALSQASSEAEFLQSFLIQIGFQDEMNHFEQNENKPRTIDMFADNQGAIYLAKNPTNHSRTKHINIHYHYVRDLLREGKVTLSYVPTAENVADIMTKGLTKETHEKFTMELGVRKLC